MALEVETDGDVVGHSLESKEANDGENRFTRYMVNHSAVLEGSYLQSFFILAHR
jgi:hypothetical protein